MNRLSALYYPYMRVQDEGLLKTALLLWDELHYITPDREWPTRAKGDVAAALEVFGRPLVPP